MRRKGKRKVLTESIIMRKRKGRREGDRRRISITVMWEVWKGRMWREVGKRKGWGGLRKGIV